MDRDRTVLGHMVLSISLLLPAFNGTKATANDLLSQLEQDVNGGVYGTIDSLLIWHDGSLLVENYYNGFTADALHTVYSTTKSVTSALVGLAVDSGNIGGVATRMLDFFPNDTPANLDTRKEAITLEDMLQMRAGFEWDESSIPYGSPGNSLYEMMNSGEDFLEYVLDLEMSAAPGTTFAYSSGVTLLLSRVLSESVGKTARGFAEETLFAELGIRSFDWPQTRTGRDTNTGWGLWMRPLDMLKFGQLYMNDGYWQPDGQLEGKQLVSQEWVDASTQRYSEGIAAPTVPTSLGYGYQWWLFDDEAPEVLGLDVNDVFFSWGFGGQFIFVAPHLDLVVVSTGENFGDSDRFFSALSDYIFPAVQPIPEPSSLAIIAIVVVLGLARFAIPSWRSV